MGRCLEGGVCNNAGKGVLVERERTRKYEMILGCSEGIYLLEANLLACCASVLMTWLRK